MQLTTFVVRSFIANVQKLEPREKKSRELLIKNYQPELKKTFMVANYYVLLF